MKMLLLSTGLAALSLVVRPLAGQDWPQWGGSSLRNNTPHGTDIPTFWEVGDFDRKTGKWLNSDAQNIKWVARLGSQSFGNPIVADGRIFVGTNNGAAYLKRYPSRTDIGCLLCFRESDGEFLWQYSSEKLPTGRVHDWPLQGICSAPLVEGKRMWFVNNRGEVVCADTEGFYDEEDDGREQGVSGRLFAALPQVNRERRTLWYHDTLRAAVESTGLQLPADYGWQSTPTDVLIVMGRQENSRRLGRLQFDGDVLRVWRVVSKDGKETFEYVGSVDADLLAGLDDGSVGPTLRVLFERRGMPLPNELAVRPLTPQKSWAITAKIDGHEQHFELRVEGDFVIAYHLLPSTDNHEADVVWKFDMMKELGVRQHNMATCCITSLGDTLFICTSNGVDNSHNNLPASDAPSFLAMDKHTGRVLWTDNSPGMNILHGQWSAPAVAKLGGVPQVIFGGGDGWLYSFRADRWSDGKPELLWKFDVNPKKSKWILGGRGTRNNIVAVPVIDDGFVYVVAGQDPEHGEGDGHLWCIDPTKRGDVSSELATRVEGDKLLPIEHRRLQAVIEDEGDIAVENPNSAVVWHYSGVDRNGDGELEFEEEFHRGIGSVAIKNDLLFVPDFSGLVHCLDAKTGHVHWTCDLLAASWGTPLIVEDKVYIGDEDGDIAIFELSADITKSIKKSLHTDRGGKTTVVYEPLREINMGNSVYTTPIVANNVLYIANKSHLFAIEHDAP